MEKASRRGKEDGQGRGGTVAEVRRQGRGRQNSGRLAEQEKSEGWEE
jgi:hypothetical protein